MDFDTLRKKALASALTTAVQYLAAVFGFHTSAKAKLLLAGPLGRLVGAFHDLNLE